jgi:branched-chain amino acid transport system ATP-binding protein
MALLECRQLSVEFGGVAALDEVHLAVEAGAIVGLIGPNGAGKTTLFNCVTGLLQPSLGVVSFDDREITQLPPFKRARMGIARTFQRLELFTSLSVRDNLRVAGDIAARWQGGAVDPISDTERVLDRLGIRHIADRDVTEIPTGMARRVELGRALLTRPRILLLDEPASGQDDTETEEFGDLLMELSADGMAILLVEHDVSLVMKVCSYIHVLDFGRILARGTTNEIRNNQSVLDAYLGQEHSP